MNTKKKQGNTSQFQRFPSKKKGRIDVSRPKYSMKRKCHVLAFYKETNKVRLVYLECKLEINMYG